MGRHRYDDGNDQEQDRAIRGKREPKATILVSQAIYNRRTMTKWGATTRPGVTAYWARRREFFPWATDIFAKASGYPRFGSTEKVCGQ